MIKTRVIIFLAIFLISQIVNGQAESENYSKQDRTTIYYIYHHDEIDSLGYSFWDIRYRMSNYSNKNNYFSFTGKLGIQGFTAYIQFEPQIEFLEMFYLNTTLGLFVRYIGIGLVNETLK